MAVGDAPSYADLQREVARLERELAEAREREAEGLAREAATGEILRVIASSPTDLQPVLDAVVKHAVNLSSSSYAVIILPDEEGLRCVAASSGYASLGYVMPIDRGSLSGRAFLDGCTVHVRDLAAELDEEYPAGKAAQRSHGQRTALATPLLRRGIPVGVLSVGRMEGRDFTDEQIALLEIFADQAVIAIENTRLFTELQERNRDLSEALEQQTATAEVLRVIASAPTDPATVLQAILDAAGRLCDAEHGLLFQLRERDGRLAHRAVRGIFREHPEFVGLGDFDSVPGLPISQVSVGGRVFLERRSITIPDMLEQSVVIEYPVSHRYREMLGSRQRSMMSSPLLRRGEPIGVVQLSRADLRPFGEREIALLESFADQAVIAIENARLFRELADRVEELRALGEVGRAVSSTLDLDAVLGTVVAHADALSGTDGGVLYEYDEAAGEFHVRATHRLGAEMIAALRSAPVRLGEGAVGRAALTREPVRVADITAEGAYRGRLLDAMVADGYRAVLAVPLLREDRILGGLVVVRKKPGAFPPNIVDLARTFASQSALAIQNARLYREVEEKSLQLEIASKHKSEFLANMSHELRTPLNAIIGFSEVLLEQMFGGVNDKQAEYLGDILSSGQHLLSLINDILDLSKVEAGRMELEVAEFSLREALENGLTMLKERASRHGISLSLTMEPDVDLIEADERKVKQVVFNLLSNAVKFTPDGGKVEVTTRRVGDGVEVAVRDTGIGIAPEDLPHVFDEFRQVGQSTAKAEGTGLGLALTRKLVELHSGSTRVESKVGVGSTFIVTLPQPPALAKTGASN